MPASKGHNFLASTANPSPEPPLTKRKLVMPMTLAISVNEGPPEFPWLIWASGSNRDEAPR